MSALASFAKLVFCCMLPGWLIGLYRLAPGSVRGSRVWPGHSGPSSSHWALDAARLGYGWRGIFEAVSMNNDRYLIPKGGFKPMARMADAGVTAVLKEAGR